MWSYTPLLALLLCVSGDTSPAIDEESMAYPEEQPLHLQDVLITSKPQHLTLLEGGDVSLPCQWKASSSQIDSQSDSQVVVLWKKLPSAILFVGQIRMSQDKRLRLGLNGQLDIGSVGPSDSGAYVCTISLHNEPLELRHTVTVQTPARLRPLASTHFRVREGEQFELVCLADGEPKPTISWSKLPVEDSEGPYFDSGDFIATTNSPEGDDLAFLQSDPTHGVSVSISHVKPHHKGTYTCTARNGIGHPDTLSTQVEVIHAPHIFVDQDVVRTARGLTARLVCKVFSNPLAEMRWERGDELLPLSSRYERTVSPRFFSLEIRNIEDSDLGNYTCHAVNTLGRSENHITLTGLPGDLKLRLGQPGRSEGDPLSCMVSWELISFSTLEDVRVILTQLSPSEGEPQVNLVPAPLSVSVAKTGSLLLSPLEGSQRYRVSVMARNKYGTTAPVTLVFSVSADGKLTVHKETAQLAPSTSVSASLPRHKLTLILLIASLSCFFY